MQANHPHKGTIQEERYPYEDQSIHIRVSFKEKNTLMKYNHHIKGFLSSFNSLPREYPDDLILYLPAFSII